MRTTKIIYPLYSTDALIWNQVMINMRKRKTNDKRRTRSSKFSFIKKKKKKSKRKNIINIIINYLIEPFHLIFTIVWILYTKRMVS